MFEEIQWGKLAAYIIGTLGAFALVVTTTILINKTVQPTQSKALTSNREQPQPTAEQLSQKDLQQSTVQIRDKLQSEEAMKDQYQGVPKELAVEACAPSKDFLTIFFSHAEQNSSWDDTIKLLMQGDSFYLLEEIDSRLIRKQDVTVPPQLTNALTQEYPRVAYCEGTSTLTGWLVTMEQKTPTDPWLVQNFHPREPELAFHPRRFIEEE